MEDPGQPGSQRLGLPRSGSRTGLCVVPWFVGMAGVSVLLSVWLAMGPQGIHQAKIEVFRLRSRGVKSHRPDPPRIRMF